MSPRKKVWAWDNNEPTEFTLNHVWENHSCFGVLDKDGLPWSIPKSFVFETRQQLLDARLQDALDEVEFLRGLMDE